MSRCRWRDPGIVVGTILAFIFSWNNFVFGAVLAGRATRTLPAAVYNVLTFEQLAWGPLAAAAIVVTLPVLLLTIVIQKEIVVGLTARRRQRRLIKCSRASIRCSTPICCMRWQRWAMATSSSSSTPIFRHPASRVA